MNEHIATRQELPRTAYLDHTLRRARTAAEQRSHRQVTLEHLLLALLDDPDAAKLIQMTGADAAAIHSTVSATVNNRMASLNGPKAAQPSFSYRFEKVFLSANREASRLGRSEIDGALILIAVGMDAESNASGILVANGFDAAEAREAVKYQAAGDAVPRLKLWQDKSPANAPRKRKTPILKAAKGSAGDESADATDDMVASVRSILEAEELKSREQGKRQGIEPRLGPSELASTGFFEAPAQDFDLEKPVIERRLPTQKPALRGRQAGLVLLASILDGIPRKTRVGVPVKIEFTLSREQAQFLSARFSRRQAQGGSVSDCRAVTLRLTAPEGAFFIETLTPETFWFLDNPAEVPAAAWAFAVVPNSAGAYGLRLSISLWEEDANGAGLMTALPDQTASVRVKKNSWQAVSRFIQMILLVFLGSGLTIAAYYGWKIYGKLP